MNAWKKTVVSAMGFCPRPSEKNPLANTKIAKASNILNTKISIVDVNGCNCYPCPLPRPIGPDGPSGLILSNWPPRIHFACNILCAPSIQFINDPRHQTLQFNCTRIHSRITFFFSKILFVMKSVVCWWVSPSPTVPFPMQVFLSVSTTMAYRVHIWHCIITTQ